MVHHQLLKGLLRDSNWQCLCLVEVSVPLELGGDPYVNPRPLSLGCPSSKLSTSLSILSTLILKSGIQTKAQSEKARYNTTALDEHISIGETLRLDLDPIEIRY